MIHCSPKTKTNKQAQDTPLLIHDLREIPFNLQDQNSTPSKDRTFGVHYGNPLQYSCLESSMDRGAWWGTVHGVAESDTTEATQQQQLSFTFCISEGNWARVSFCQQKDSGPERGLPLPSLPPNLEGQAPPCPLNLLL